MTTPNTQPIKLPVRYDDNQLAVIDADGETLCHLDNWLDEIEMDGKRRGDLIADALNACDAQADAMAELVEAARAFELLVLRECPLEFRNGSVDAEYKTTSARLKAAITKAKEQNK